MNIYQIYGTGICSDCEFPLELPCFVSRVNTAASQDFLYLSAAAPKALEEELSSRLFFYHAHGRKVFLHSNTSFEDYESGREFCYEVENVLRFYWRSGEQTILYTLETQGNDELLAFWFIHLLLPLYYTLENRYHFLHAGAVDVTDKRILFIAPSMGGKSTMIDFFLHCGHPLVCDDKLPSFFEDGRFMTASSHPYHRPYRAIETLGHKAASFSAANKPVHGIFTLDPQLVDTTLPAPLPITISEIHGFDKFKALQPAHLYEFPFLKPRALPYLTTLLNSVPIFRLRFPFSFSAQAGVHEAIVHHCETLP